MTTTHIGVVFRAGIKGYCWLQQIPLAENRTAIFCHVSDVVGQKILMAGDRVSFEIEMAERGPRARNVELLPSVRPNEVRQ
jgi:cold shock CspA family protein